VQLETFFYPAPQIPLEDGLGTRLEMSKGQESSWWPQLCEVGTAVSCIFHPHTDGWRFRLRIGASLLSFCPKPCSLVEFSFYPSYLCLAVRTFKCRYQLSKPCATVSGRYNCKINISPYCQMDIYNFHLLKVSFLENI
jgi:hypothetical protein